MTRRGNAEISCKEAYRCVSEGAYEVAASKFAEGREFYVRQNEDKTAAQLYIMEGVCAYLVGQSGKAVACFQAAEAIGRRLALGELVAVARYNIALLYAYTGNEEKMRQLAEGILPAGFSDVSEDAARLCRQAQSVCALRTSNHQTVIKLYDKRSPPSDPIEVILLAIAHLLNREANVAEKLLRKRLMDASIAPLLRAQLLLQLSVVRARQQDLASAREILTRANAEALRGASELHQDYQQPPDVPREVLDMTYPLLIMEQVAQRMAAYSITSAVRNWSELRDGDSCMEMVDFIRDVEASVQQLQPLRGRPSIAAERLRLTIKQHVVAYQTLCSDAAMKPLESADRKTEHNPSETGILSACYHVENLDHPAQPQLSSMDIKINNLMQELGGLGMGFGLTTETAMEDDERLLQLYQSANGWLEATESAGDLARAAKLAFCVSCMCLRLNRVLEAKRLALKAIELCQSPAESGVKAMATRLCIDVTEYFPSDDPANTMQRLHFCKQFVAAATESCVTELIKDAHQRLANCYIDIAEGRTSVEVADVSAYEIVETVQSTEEDIAREETDSVHLYTTARARAQEVMQQMLESMTSTQGFHPRS